MDAVEPVVTHPDARVRPRRAITGMSAVLLPHTAGGAVDWDGLAAHVARTAGAGLTPAVNMDTGFVQVLDEATRDRVLEVAAANSDGFVAGAHLDDRAGDRFDLEGYRRQVDRIVARGVRSALGFDMPVFGKRRFQHGATSVSSLRENIPAREGQLRKKFLELYS